MFQSTFLSKYCFTSSVDQATSFGSFADVPLPEAVAPAPGIRKALASSAMPSEVDKTRIGFPSGVKNFDANGSFAVASCAAAVSVRVASSSFAKTDSLLTKKPSYSCVIGTSSSSSLPSSTLSRPSTVSNSRLPTTR
ncbi:hypothetical protein D3C76_1131940 [compost metagenome]